MLLHLQKDARLATTCLTAQSNPSSSQGDDQCRVSLQGDVAQPNIRHIVSKVLMAGFDTVASHKEL